MEVSLEQARARMLVGFYYVWKTHFLADWLTDWQTWFNERMNISIATTTTNIGDQIVEWNGVNLCNRSNEEVQQILFSQFTDDEVEIVYLKQDKFNQAYGGMPSTGANSAPSTSGLLEHPARGNPKHGPTFAGPESSYASQRAHLRADLQLTGDSVAQDTFESFSNINKAGDSLLSAGMKQENPLFGTTTASSRNYDHMHHGKSTHSSPGRRKLSLSSIANMWKWSRYVVIAEINTLPHLPQTMVNDVFELFVHLCVFNSIWRPTRSQWAVQDGTNRNRKLESTWAGKDKQCVARKRFSWYICVSFWW